jgi:hypothetical protein
VRTKPLTGLAPLAVCLEVEVGTVITVLTVDAALQHICGIFREQADRGDITPTERDLLIDGAHQLSSHMTGGPRPCTRRQLHRE